MILAWAGAVLGPLLVLLTARRWAARRPRLALAFAAIGALGWGLWCWSFLVEPETLVVRRVAVESPDWRGPPLRIGVISDLHIGSPHVDSARVQAVVERMNAEHPDIVVLLGDYVGTVFSLSGRDAPRSVEVLVGISRLKGLKAPHGLAAVLGNHDGAHGGPLVAAALRRAGATVLSNDAVRIDRPGGGYWVAGLADLVNGTEPPLPTRSFRRVAPGEPAILLAHEPDLFAETPGGVALMLAGHTHCGQINLPIIGQVVAASHGAWRWPCGLYREAGKQLYVTGGIGTSVVPARLGAPPEIVILTLSAGGSPAAASPAATLPR